ncbi:MAG TPA: LysE family translocator [bacterium]|nr:LysE family translocator [bacterium]
MTTEQAAAFLLFAVAAAGTPGPSNVMLTATGAQVGVLRGLPCLFGQTTGMGLMLFFVLSGLGSLVLGHPPVLRALHWSGAVVLLWLSWKIATASRTINAASGRRAIGYLDAAIFQWVNPKAWLVAASAAGTFLTAGAGSPVVQAASLGVLFFLVALPSCFLWLAFGAGVQRLLRTPRRLRTFNITMGALLALSIVLIIR